VRCSGHSAGDPLKRRLPVILLRIPTPLHVECLVHV
jgi:hypothetical protein